jgi:beta-galactosidase
VLRASPNGLSRGFMWLNGHSLGRYPERSPVDGLYLPECWLKPGRNTLVIFDEEGHTPDGVKIVDETVADRTAMELATREAPAPSR